MSDWAFNANDVPPSAGFDPIPDGEYEVVIVGCDWKATKRGDGEYLKLTLQVVGGEFENRLLWDQLNLINPSEKARVIASGTLSAICRAVGVMDLRKDEVWKLQSKPLVDVVRTETSDQYPKPKNVIARYKAKAGAKEAISKAMHAASQTAAEQQQGPPADDEIPF